MKTEHGLRKEMVEISHAVWERGWVANHDGNATARVAPGRILATPTAVSKRVIDREMLIVLNDEGVKLRGRMRAFSERGLHLQVYRSRPDVGAVLHAHPPHAMAWSLGGAALPSFTPEAVVSIGEATPVVPLSFPGSEAEAALSPFLQPYDVVMLASHGVLAWGDDLEQAFLRMELVEHLARVALLAKSYGGVQPLSPEFMGPLLKKRASAGLGPEGRGR